MRAQWLFQRVFFAPRKSAIETFLNISANPTFTQGVTELVYDGRLFFEEFTDYDSYKTSFNATAQSEDYGDTSTAGEAEDSILREFASIKLNPEYHKTLANNLVRYARLFDQQQSIFEDNRNYEALSTGFKKNSNIRTVIALDNFFECCDWVPLRTDDFTWYHERSQNEIAAPVGPTSWARNKTSGEDEIKKWDVRGIQNLIRAISRYGHQVIELHLASELSSAPMSIFEMDQDVYDDVCVLARRLKLLKMGLYMSKSDSEDEHNEQEDCLDEILSETKELHCLAVSGRIDIDLFRNKVWPHLETLNLGDVGLHADDLKAITQAHKDTLRELTFRKVNLHGEEGWADAAKEIGRYLKLRHISILGVSDDVTSEETETPYLEDEINLAVARSFMQSIPRTTLLDDPRFTIIAFP